MAARGTRRSELQVARLLANTVNVFGGVRGIGFAPYTLANPNLKWETTDGIDFGVDATLFRSRVSVTADYYSKKTRDMLYNVAVPATTGFGTSLQNIGSLRNRGFELSVSTTNLTGALGWESTLNLAWNRNKVLDLGGHTGGRSLSVRGWRGAPEPDGAQGGRAGQLILWLGLCGVNGGKVVYQDLDGDGVITSNDRTIIGNAQPKYTGGLNNRFTFRNFDLSVFLQWSVGNKIYNINRSLLTAAEGRRTSCRTSSPVGRALGSRRSATRLRAPSPICSSRTVHTCAGRTFGSPTASPRPGWTRCT